MGSKDIKEKSNAQEFESFVDIISNINANC